MYRIQLGWFCDGYWMGFFPISSFLERMALWVHGHCLHGWGAGLLTAMVARCLPFFFPSQVMTIPQIFYTLSLILGLTVVLLPPLAFLLIRCITGLAGWIVLSFRRGNL